MSLRRRPRTAYTKRGGGLEERWEEVGGGIAYFRLLPFFSHIWLQQSYFVSTFLFRNQQFSRKASDKPLMLLNGVYSVNFISLCSKLIINITILVHKTNLKGNIL